MFFWFLMKFIFGFCLKFLELQGKEMGYWNLLQLFKKYVESIDRERMYIRIDKNY